MSALERQGAPSLSESPMRKKVIYFRKYEIKNIVKVRSYERLKNDHQ
jgi:hypothetical protein